jgi:aryl-alcohol dehydrogenase-like predicted oxidoreductase
MTKAHTLRGPELVFGCARIGSTLSPLDAVQSIALLRRAYELGIRHFDTASCYGQGDSERLLGAALAPLRAEVYIASKAGQRLSTVQQLLLPFKQPLRRWVRQRSGLRGAVAQRRARGLPKCFEPGYIERSLDASLERLRTDHLDLFYLHSPPPEALREPEPLLRVVERARAAGKLVRFGVSCDEPATAEAALALPGVEVLQLEHDGSARCTAILERAAALGIAIYLRGAARAADAVQALRAQLALPGVAGVLMGTLQLAHLEQNVHAFACATVPLSPAADGDTGRRARA